MAQHVGMASDMTTGYQQTQAFLDLILSGTARGEGQWDAASQRWVPSNGHDDD
jgi:hypothetical protein